MSTLAEHATDSLSRFNRAFARRELAERFRASAFRLLPGDPRPSELRSTLLELVELARTADGEVWVSRREIAEAIGSHKDTVGKSIRCLERHGLLRREPPGYKRHYDETIVLLFGRTLSAVDEGTDERRSSVYAVERATDSEGLQQLKTPSSAETVWAAYLVACSRRHGAELVPRASPSPPEYRHLLTLTGWLARRAEATGRSLCWVAAVAMAAYFAESGHSDRKLEAKRHPIAWWGGYAAEMDGAIVREHAKRARVAEQRAARTEPPPQSTEEIRQGAAAVAMGASGQLFRDAASSTNWADDCSAGYRSSIIGGNRGASGRYAAARLSVGALS